MSSSEEDYQLRLSLLYSPEFQSTAGDSSELLSWEVALIMISLMVFLTIVILLSLHCNDRRKRKKVSDIHEETTCISFDQDEETRQDEPKLRKVGVVHHENLPSKSSAYKHSEPTIKTVSANDQPPPYSSLNLQRNAGYYYRGMARESLPPLPTSVFLISLPTPTDFNHIHQVQDRYI